MANQKPFDTVRIGSVKAAIWTNDTAKGVRYNVTFERLYKDGNDWRYTSHFNRDDLLLVAKVADLAHSRICELQQAADETRRAA